jgi:hypothetical protein
VVTASVKMKWYVLSCARSGCKGECLQSKVLVLIWFPLFRIPCFVFRNVIFSSFFRFVIQIKYMNNLMANICLLRFSIDDHLEIP